ncbi:hypothetical protein CathTA2_2187 [Caldalkalibacillus thermarum TA2.A1]|uniref:Uncharacterized protein n=1 Tax=Caldalkalibacillus thermarum (strain TA2.A1) TaxID=986075 RepID=F5L8N2_CALTT|nr:hypothetical protein [Caldalkalibacillus thermarum]EGL82271.1 hypothetical protein CathTA2_2187 [Caldalkalibacillus thermarum TA2.A1]QZT33434.1 hypothetical protein HUR95_14455 [Caldalkalibacillus thermarum TA2.A1]GGK16629.1 hypothetical protein GCM10010965_07110 [Caldalkalibacillus thermarum]
MQVVTTIHLNEKERALIRFALEHTLRYAEIDEQVKKYKQGLVELLTNFKQAEPFHSRAGSISVFRHC